MPWRGPEVPGEFPTLGYLVADWIEAHCAVPDRHVRGQPFKLSDEQLEHLLWEYRLHPSATVDADRPSAPFVFVGNVLVRPQKWGKGPFSASRVCAQAAGPVLFAGWDADGEPVGMPWPTPHIQVTAVSEDQTKNIWRALLPMIQLGSVGEWIEDTGQQQIYLPNGGLVERVTSSFISRLGQRITYVEQDESHSMLERNGGQKLADTQRRNVAGTGGRWSATTNAWDPAENSQAQLDYEAVTSGLVTDVYLDYPEPLEGSWANKRDRRRILKHAYRGAPWVDVNRIESECNRLDAKKDPAQAERFFGNRLVAGASAAFDLDHYKTLARPARTIAPGRKVTGGFDGSIRHDHTGLVVTDIETGHQAVVAWWGRPPDLQPDEEWRVPLVELNEAVDFMFSTWDVWRLYGDPPHYRDDLSRWAGKYGDDRVIEWWMAERKKTAYALREFRADMGAPGEDGEPRMTHGPLRLDGREPNERALAAHAALVQQIGNSVRRLTNIRDDEDGSFLWLIGKDGQHSPRKIDLAACACLSWVARTHALRAGVLEQKTYDRASWGGGTARPSAKKTDRSEYLPCRDCGKRIHPALHKPGAEEQGRCLKCRGR